MTPAQSEALTNPKVEIAEPEILAGLFADRVAAEAQAAVAARGRFSCALTGGSVAELFFPVLARAPISWANVEFFWSDERAVEPDDSDSNYGLARRLLLDPVRADPRRVHRIVAERGDLDAAARAYESELVRVLGEPPCIDLVILGVGPDGHVCSLFPGHALLRERQRRVAAITDSPKPPPRRITFTLPLLALGRTICVAAFGNSKATAIREALEDPGSQIPVALTLRSARNTLVLVDAEAAGLLGEQEPPRA